LPSTGYGTEERLENGIPRLGANEHICQTRVSDISGGDELLDPQCLDTDGEGIVDAEQRERGA
jgi:hypothetical protein